MKLCDVNKFERKWDWYCFFLEWGKFYTGISRESRNSLSGPGVGNLDALMHHQHCWIYLWGQCTLHRKRGDHHFTCFVLVLQLANANVGRLRRSTIPKTLNLIYFKNPRFYSHYTVNNEIIIKFGPKIIFGSKNGFRNLPILKSIYVISPKIK